MPIEPEETGNTCAGMDPEKNNVRPVSGRTRSRFKPARITTAQQVLRWLLNHDGGAMSALDVPDTGEHLGEHFRLCQQRLHGIAYMWCRNHPQADDLVQETFAKALKNIGQLREAKALDAWLYHILYHCWLDTRRRERPTEDIDEVNEAGELVSDTAPEDGATAARVRAAVLRLPDGQREVLTLVDVAGFSYGEVSTILNIPVGTVTSRISRARETLRDDLAELVCDGFGHANVIQMRSTA
jgi:RNA polymerase sigma-70 factor (ECF subfamily)